MNKFFEKHSSLFIVLVCCWIIIGPLLLTQNLFSIKDLNSSGQIGDAIGGITAPVIGLLSIILLYLTLIKQNEKNSIDAEESNFRFLYGEVENLSKSINSFEYANKKSNEAFVMFSVAFETQIVNPASAAPITDFELDAYDTQILGKFIRLFVLINKLRTSESFKDIIIRDAILNYNQAAIPQLYQSLINHDEKIKTHSRFMILKIHDNIKFVFQKMTTIQNNLMPLLPED